MDCSNLNGNAIGRNLNADSVFRFAKSFVIGKYKKSTAQACLQTVRLTLLQVKWYCIF